MQEKQYRLKRIYQSYGKVYVPGVYNESELPVFLRGREDYTEPALGEPALGEPASIVDTPDVITDIAPLTELRSKLRKPIKPDKPDKPDTPDKEEIIDAQG